jgi:cytoskeletal protein CcmA (bactofilin family)
MALWKDSPAPTPAAPAGVAPEPPKSPVNALDSDATRRVPAGATASTRAETVISAGLTMEGKISSGDDVRIAGQFKGDVNVEGHFRIDKGGRLEGQVASIGATIAGELQGNINAAKHVELLTSGVIVGDIKAASITVADGARMRGHVEFGWDDSTQKTTFGGGKGAGS